MKTKYFAVTLVGVALLSCGLTYSLVRQGTQPGWRPGTQLTELQALAQQLQRNVRALQGQSDLLASSMEQVTPARALPAEPALLVAAAPEVKAPTQRKAAAPAWWRGYSLSMVMLSDGVRSAVINGRYLRAGDSLGKGIVVRQVQQDSVILERRGQRATLAMQKK